MSPRPIRTRKISNSAIISGFRPYGNNKTDKKPEIVFLCLEEYEALHLCDFNRLNHYQASQTMDISRPTQTRIYARARQKIAEAIVPGKQIIIKSGNVYFDSDWYSYKSCGCYFNYPDKQKEKKECPMCKSPDIISYECSPEIQGLPDLGLKDVCICPRCGFERYLVYGSICKNEVCPNCHYNMFEKELYQSDNKYLKTI